MGNLLTKAMGKVLTKPVGKVLDIYTEEVIALTKVIGEFGGIYHTHQRSEEKYMVETAKETIRIGKETGVYVNVTHIKTGGKSNWGKMKEAVRLINEARSKGICVSADMYPYDKAALGSISGKLNIPNDMEPFAELQKKRRDRNIPVVERQKLIQQYADELAKALSDPAKRRQIKKLTAEELAKSGYSWDCYSIFKRNCLKLKSGLLKVTSFPSVHGRKR